MRHDLRLMGHRFALRPVAMSDAAFILTLRNDPQLNRSIHPTSPRVEDQEAWLAAYMDRPGDYYFIVDDPRSAEPVGAISIYEMDEAQRTSEWGRWLIRRDSVAAVESALLMYRAAFELLGLESVYSRTVADNEAVVSFHDSSGAERAGLLKQAVRLGEKQYDVVEHRVTRDHWPTMQPRLDAIARGLALK
jgi:RimJ/RimL family protein N-acetyltransferase